MAFRTPSKATPAVPLVSASGFVDLCGQADGSERHDHSPFCHKLCEPPEIRITPRLLRLVLIPDGNETICCLTLSAAIPRVAARGASCVGLILPRQRCDDQNWAAMIADARRGESPRFEHLEKS